MLRKIRITLAVLCFVPVTLLFLDFTGTIHAWFGWLAKIQFLPAVLALNLGVVAAFVLLTLLLGRVYCSVVCPLGVMQDVFGRLGRRHRKNRYSHSPALSWLRYTVLSLFVVALAAGVGSVVALLDPYGAYGRIASNLFAPLWQWGNNLLAGFAERAGSYAFYRTDVWIKSLPTFAIAVAMFAALAQRESEAISERMRWSYQFRIRQGRFSTCKAPFGYRLIKDHLEVREDEATVIRYIFERYLAGISADDIAKEITAMGHSTRDKTPYWQSSTVLYVLRNEKYVGDSLSRKKYTTQYIPWQQKLNHGKYDQVLVKDSHPPIISREVFSKTQKLLKRKNAGIQSDAQIEKAFTRKVTCGN